MLLIITMLKEWVYRVLTLLFFVVNLTGCSQSKQEGEQSISIQENLLKKVSDQCSDVPSDNPGLWEMKREGDGMYELERQKSNHKEFLRLYMENDSSRLRGYYDVETDSSYLNYRLIKCDTTIYFEMRQTARTIDTVFYIGYYKYLFDKNLLTSGQKRFFSRNRDSLISVRGDNLEPLPEFGRIIPAKDPAFEEVDQ